MSVLGRSESAPSVLAAPALSTELSESVQMVPELNRTRVLAVPVVLTANCMSPMSREAIKYSIKYHLRNQLAQFDHQGAEKDSRNNCQSDREYMYMIYPLVIKLTVTPIKPTVHYNVV